jgi:hypothetical protein
MNRTAAVEANPSGPRCKAEWGLDAPQATLAMWGARAISLQTGFDLLHDRQDIQGQEPHRGALIALLNDKGILARARKTWVTLKNRGEVRDDESRRVVLVDHPSIRVEASTNGSYGYVYLVAYLLEGVEA